MLNNKPLLAFDCASLGASIAVQSGGKTYARNLPQGKQAAELIPVIDALMREAAVSYADLGAILTTVGPGSFTGLRIALAAMHGFVLVHQTPVKTLTSLEAMAWSIATRPGTPTAFTIALRAGKGELFTQEFRNENSRPQATSEIMLVPETKSDWSTPCFNNQLAADHPNYLSGPDCAVLCAIADQLAETSLADALPLYIRPPDAKIPQAHAWLT